MQTTDHASYWPCKLLTMQTTDHAGDTLLLIPASVIMRTILWFLVYACEEVWGQIGLLSPQKECEMVWTFKNFAVKAILLLSFKWTVLRIFGLSFNVSDLRRTVTHLYLSAIAATGRCCVQQWISDVIQNKLVITAISAIVTTISVMSVLGPNFICHYFLMSGGSLPSVHSRQRNVPLSISQQWKNNS